MVKFLADENIPPVIIEFIRKRGFNIEDVYKIGKPGLSDEGIMEIARAEGRILITFDKHFADIINYPPYSHHGVIRIRIHPPLISSLIEAFERFLEKFDLSKFEGTLVVLERNGFRVRRAS
jgi:predicted nuclease of predicted toxin-antitoxin system